MTETNVLQARMPLMKTIAGTVCALLLTACVATEDAASDNVTAAPAPAVSATTLANPLERSSNRKLLEAMDICLEDFPNLQQVRSKLRVSGYASEGTFGNKEIFTAYNRSIIVVVSASASDRLCSFGLDGLRNQQAVLLAGSMFAARSNGTLKTGTLNDPKYIAAFQFDAPNGAPVIAAVGRQTTFPGIFRGSMIFLTEYKG